MPERWHDRYFGKKNPPEGKADPYTSKQRKFNLERDGHQSQLRHYSEEKGFHTKDGCVYDGKPCPHLQVHHIDPRGAGGESTPENGVTLTECQHTGRCPSGRIGKGFYRE